MLKVIKSIKQQISITQKLDRIDDNSIKKCFKRFFSFGFLTLVIFSMVFMIPINPYAIISTNGSEPNFAYASSHIPIKVDHQRGGEIWDLWNNASRVFVAGSSPPRVFNNATIYTDGDDTWVDHDLDILGGGDYDVLSGRIGTKFIGSTITHYNIVTGQNVGTETLDLVRWDGTTFVNEPLTFVSRTHTTSTVNENYNVTNVSVTDTHDTITITETWTSTDIDIVIDYFFDAGEPLKHTFTATKTTAGSEIYELWHEFNLVEEEIEIESKGSLTADFKKIKLQVKQGRIFFKTIFTNGTEIDQESESTLTIDKATYVDILQQIKFTKQSGGELILTEIVAPSTTDPAFVDFIELFIDATADPIFQFRYGNYTVSQGQSFQLDPDTYSSNSPTKDTYLADDDDNGVCSTSSLSDQDTNISLIIGMEESSNPFDCYRALVEWDTTSVPDTATISTVTFKHEIGTVQANAENCDITEMDFQPSTRTVVQNFNDIADGNVYIDNSTWCKTTGQNTSIDLGSTAVTDLQNLLSSDWFAIGIKGNDETQSANDEWIQIKSEDNLDPAVPKPTLEVVYTDESDIIPRFFENDGSTVVSTGEILQANSSTTRTISVNSTGQAKFTGLSGNQNFTFKETTDNYVVNQTINYNAVAYDLWATPDSSTFIHRIDCSSNGAGNDAIIKTNGTDGHHITSYSTPTCNSNDEITWSITWTANGQDSVSYSSSMIVEVLDSGFQMNPEKFVVDSTTISTTYNTGTNKATSSSFTIGDGLTTVTSNLYLRLADIRTVPVDVNFNNGTAFTGGTVIQSNSSSTNNSFSLDGAGQVSITGLNSLQNFTVLDSNNYIVDKDYNYNVSSASTRTLNTNIFTVDCSDNGSGTDLEIVTNGTDVHRISSFATPSCSASNVVTWDVTWTANGLNDTSFNSLVRVNILNITEFGANASELLSNDTAVSTTYSSPAITSSEFTIGSGLNTIFRNFTLSLTYLAKVPTGLSVICNIASACDLSWTAPTNTGNGTISAYQIERESPVGGGFSVIVADTGSTTTTYTDSPLTADTVYNYRISTINEVGTGSPSTESSATTSVAGGGTSGGGGGGRPSIPSIIEEFFGVSLTSIFHTLVLGEVIKDQRLTVSWDSSQDLIITRLSADSMPFTFVFPSIPLLLYGDFSGMSQQDILYSIQVPNKECGKIQEDDCILLKKYEIPVSIQGEIGTKTVQQNSIITIDLTSNIDFVLYVIFGAVMIPVVGFMASRLSHRSKGYNPTRGKHQRKKIGTARNSLSR